MSADSGPNGAVRRIRRLGLSNFRAFSGEQVFEFEDADVVLLTGLNGCGKSSVLVALGLLLSGWGPYESSSHLHLGGSLGEDTEGGRASEWLIWMEYNACGDPGRLFTRQISWSPRKGLQSFEGTAGATRVQLDFRRDVLGPLPGDLCFRATAFLQDALDLQLESARALAPESTLIDFLSPLPGSIAAYIEELTRLTHGWRSRLAEDRDLSGDTVAEAARQVESAADSFLAAYQEHCRTEGLRPASDATGSESPTERVGAVVSNLLQTSEAPGTPQRLADRLHDWIREQAHGRATRGRLVRDNVPDLRGQLRIAEAKLAEFERNHPGLDAARAYFGGPEGLPHLLGVLEGLALRPDRWTRSDDLGAYSIERLSELARMLAGVDTPLLERHAGDLRAWLSRVDSDWEERRRLSQEVDHARAGAAGWIQPHVAEGLLRSAKELQSALRRHESVLLENSEVDRRRGRSERLAAGVTALNNELEFWRHLQTARLPQRVNEEVQAVTERLRQTMNLLEPLELGACDPASSHALRVMLPGKRLPKEHFSTGQTVYASLLLLLAQNRLLQRWLGHRVLLVDDLSSALDLTNLVGAAATLRQVAYADQEAVRRQVFLAAHHDELTHRLREYLLPPERQRLRIIRFEDWSLKQGPTCRQSWLKPARLSSPDLREQLGSKIDRASALARSSSAPSPAPQGEGR